MIKKLCLLILMIGLLLIFACKSKTETPKSEEFTGAKYVKTEQAYISDIQSLLEYSGKIEAEKFIDIAPLLSLKIQNIYIKEGDYVKKGTLLASLDKNTLVQLEATFKNAEKNYQRAKNLLVNNAIDQRSFDDIEALFINTKANYESNLDNLQIKAPFDGVITTISQKTGETYSPLMGNVSGINGLFRLMNLSTMKAKIKIPDKDLIYVKRGHTVNIRSDANPNQIFSGSVILVIPEANAISGLYTCEISIKNSNKLLKHNQYARFEVIKQSAKNVLLVPISAIIDSNIVFTVENNKAKKHLVKTGIYNKKQVQILDGLTKDDLVITEGSLGLKDGTSVIIK